MSIWVPVLAASFELHAGKLASIGQRLASTKQVSAHHSGTVFPPVDPNDPLPTLKRTCCPPGYYGYMQGTTPSCCPSGEDDFSLPLSGRPLGAGSGRSACSRGALWQRTQLHTSPLHLLQRNGMMPTISAVPQQKVSEATRAAVHTSCSWLCHPVSHSLHCCASSPPHRCCCSPSLLLLLVNAPIHSAGNTKRPCFRLRRPPTAALCVTGSGNLCCSQLSTETTYVCKDGINFDECCPDGKQPGNSMQCSVCILRRLALAALSGL